jgi:hypothetical protein
MQGRLNVFQRTMLQWNELHPYNAVHVVRIPGALDLERLRSVISRTLEYHGLTSLTLNRGRGAYQYHGAPARWEIKTIGAGDAERASLYTEIERELNTAFAFGEHFNPFRFFVALADDSFSLGVVYFHAVTDAESLVLLMRDIVDTYLNRIGPCLSSAFDLYPRCYDNLFRYCPKVLLRKLAAVPSSVRAIRNSTRPRYHDAQNLNNGFAFLSLTTENLSGLIEAGKSWGVTLNDLFLALLMKALSPLASRRARARRRRNISVGCIVNIRRDLGMDSQRTFGLFLGSFVVTHGVPNEVSLMDLAKDIQRQTGAIKRGRLYVGAPLELAFVRLLLSFYSTDWMKKFYQKHFPLWGGITNMNLNSLWKQQEGEEPIDYFRAVSTGPVTPLVVSVTTVRDWVNIGLTYRTTVFSVAEIEHVKKFFLETVKHLEVPG